MIVNKTNKYARFLTLSYDKYIWSKISKLLL